MSVTKCLTKSYDQENQLISTIQELNHNQSNTNATVIWIPAHQGIEGNEKADAAIEAPVASLTNNRKHLPIPCDDQIIHGKIVAKNEWNNTWKTTKSKLHKFIQDFHQPTSDFNNRKEGIIVTQNCQQNLKNHPPAFIPINIHLQ